jgi:hypothetical protein
MTSATTTAPETILIPDAEARTALGEVRFLEWQATGTPYYESFRQFALANNISPETVKAVSRLLIDTANTSWRIASDETLGVAEKKTTLAELATATRAQVTTHLGARHAPTFLRLIRWLDELGTGTAVQFNGSTTFYRSVDIVMRPPPTPAAPRPPSAIPGSQP